jgi:hypothetical protein
MTHIQVNGTVPNAIHNPNAVSFVIETNPSNFIALIDKTMVFNQNTICVPTFVGNFA